MRQDKTKAIQLRKKGKSYQYISDFLNIPKSTLSNWFSNVEWSEKTKSNLSKMARENARKRMMIISHKRRNELKENYKRQKIIAENQFKKFVKDKLFIAGLMIYWGEGDSKLENGMIRVANTDPLMIKLFYKFLQKYLPKISHKAKIYLILYPDLDDNKCKNYWSKEVGLSLNKFMGSSYIQGKCPTKRLSYGVGNITISSRLYKEQIIAWIKLVRRKNII